MDSALYYFLKDQVGSTRAMVNDSGTMVMGVDYLPFGEIHESWTVYDEPMLYTGKEHDDYRAFDYYYFGSRYYDPEIGSFSSIDKAGQFPEAWPRSQIAVRRRRTMKPIDRISFNDSV